MPDQVEENANAIDTPTHMTTSLPVWFTGLLVFQTVFLAC